MVFSFMFSAHPSPEIGEKTGAAQLGVTETKRARDRARYLSMSPEQVETLRQNKKKYYLNKKNAGPARVGPTPIDEILEPNNGIFESCSFIIAAVSA
jgi:hypothetical protein